MTQSSLSPRGRRVIKWLFALLAAMAAAIVTMGVLVWRYPLASLAVAGRGALQWSGFERVETPYPRGAIAYFRAGAGDTVVFVHGANDQAGSWARIAPALDEDHRVVVVDLAGHGDSDPRQGPLGIRDLVDGVAAVVEAERQGGKVTLVGNSLGGFLALVHADRHPDEVRHVIVVNGAINRTEVAPAAITLLPKTREEARKAMDALTSPGTPRMPSFVLDDLVRRAPASPLAKLMAQPQDELEEFLIDDRLDLIQVPVTMIWGEDDQLLSLTYARQAAARLPRARLEVIPHCGHVPQRECPEPMLARLRESLARVAREGASTPGGE